MSVDPVLNYMIEKFVYDMLEEKVGLLEWVTWVYFQWPSSCRLFCYLSSGGELFISGLNWVVQVVLVVFVLNYWFVGAGWACLSSYLRRSFLLGFCLFRGSFVFGCLLLCLMILVVGGVLSEVEFDL